MKIDLGPDEKLIREGAANLQRGIESVGGRLYLTDARLVFLSHVFNVQSGPAEIPLSAVRSVQPGWTRFLGVLPLIPNTLAVRTDQAEYRFVLFGRSSWARAIRSAAASARGGKP